MGHGRRKASPKHGERQQRFIFPRTTHQPSFGSTKLVSWMWKGGLFYQWTLSFPADEQICPHLKSEGRDRRFLTMVGTCQHHLAHAANRHVGEGPTCDLPRPCHCLWLGATWDAVGSLLLLLCKMLQIFVPCQAVEAEGWGWKVRVCPVEVHHKASPGGGR